MLVASALHVKTLSMWRLQAEGADRETLTVATLMVMEAAKNVRKDSTLINLEPALRNYQAANTLTVNASAATNHSLSPPTGVLFQDATN